MKLKVIIPALLLVFAQVYAQGTPDTLNDIAGNISSYKDQTVTLVLRLKYIDDIFEKIIFYDKDNIDIEFSFEGKRKKQLYKYFLNAHNGLEYLVTFTVTGKNALGTVQGILVSFKPVVMDKIHP